jgi:hypothetical protein
MTGRGAERMQLVGLDPSLTCQRLTRVAPVPAGAHVWTFPARRGGCRLSAAPVRYLHAALGTAG